MIKDHGFFWESTAWDVSRAWESWNLVQVPKIPSFQNLSLSLLIVVIGHYLTKSIVFLVTGMGFQPLPTLLSCPSDSQFRLCFKSACPWAFYLSIVVLTTLGFDEVNDLVAWVSHVTDEYDKHPTIPGVVVCQHLQAMERTIQISERHSQYAEKERWVLTRQMQQGFRDV